MQLYLQPKGRTPRTVSSGGGAELDYALPEFGLRVAFRPTEFTQVNHAVNRVLVRRAVALLDPQPGERVADLSAGWAIFRWRSRARARA